MRYINTYLGAVEELPEGCDPTTTQADHLGYLSPCDPKRAYQGSDAESLPRMFRKPTAHVWEPEGHRATRWTWYPEPTNPSKSVMRRLAIQRGQS